MMKNAAPDVFKKKKKIKPYKTKNPTAQRNIKKTFAS